MDPLKQMSLAVVSHVTHYSFDGRTYAYGPYSQEIDLWANLFGTITICSPLRAEAPPPDCLPFTSSNIRVAPQWELGGDTLISKLKLLLGTPLMAARLASSLRHADAIHVRCPGNLGLLGVLLAPLFSRNLVAKYAAQWNHREGEPSTWRWQKALLASRWWRGPVTVYGEWPDQPAHVVPFFTSLLSPAHLERAHRSAELAATQPPGWNGPLRVLFTGRLTRSKNVDALLRAIARCQEEGVDIRLTLLGEGPEEGSLRTLAAELKIESSVAFVGGVPFENVLAYLEQSHVLVLASNTEGWPKSLAEAMAFGLIAIGSNRGLVPTMLGRGRGLLVEPGEVPALARHLVDIARHPERYTDMRQAAAAWSQGFSLNGLQAAIDDLLRREWNLPERETPQPGTGGVESHPV